MKSRILIITSIVFALLAVSSFSQANAVLAESVEATGMQIIGPSDSPTNMPNFKEDAYHPFVTLYISNDNSENYVIDEKLGKIYPCALNGVYKDCEDEKSFFYYDYDTQELRNKITSKTLSAKNLPQGDESVVLYRNEKWIGDGKLVKYTTDEGTTAYGIRLDDQMLELDNGYYIAVNGQWNAVPRPITQLDELGSMLVDLNNDSMMVQLNLTIVDLAAYYDTQKMYLDVYCEFNKTSFMIGNGSEEALSQPAFRSYVYVYDLDGDGTMEIVVFESSTGGTGIEIYKVVDETPTLIFWENNE